MSKQIHNPYLSPSKKKPSDGSISSAPDTSQTSITPVRRIPVRNPYQSSKKVLAGALIAPPKHSRTPKENGKNLHGVCLADDVLIAALETAEKSRKSHIEPFLSATDSTKLGSPSPVATKAPVSNPYKTTAVKRSPIIVNPYLKKNTEKVPSTFARDQHLNFDDVCLEDSLLLQALENAEKKRTLATSAHPSRSKRLKADDLNIITQDSQEYEQNSQDTDGDSSQQNSLTKPTKPVKSDEFDCRDDTLHLPDSFQNISLTTPIKAVQEDAFDCLQDALLLPDSFRNISLTTPMKAVKDDEIDCLDDTLLLQALDTAEKVKAATKTNVVQDSHTTTPRSLRSAFDAAIPNSPSPKPLARHQQEHETLILRLISMRMALDKYVRQLASKHQQYVPHSLVDAIDVLRTKKVIPMELADGMHEIQWLGHLAMKNGDAQLPGKFTIDSLFYKYREQKQKYESSLIPRGRKIY